MPAVTRERLQKIHDAANQAIFELEDSRHDLMLGEVKSLCDDVSMLLLVRDVLLEALVESRNYGSHGDTEEGVSVSYLIEKAIAKAKE